MDRQRWIRGAAGVLALAVLMMLVFISSGCGPDLTPEELARRWVSDNTDAAGEAIAGWMSAGNPVLRELGGEYIEDRIHEVVSWEYSAAGPRPDGWYGLTATARVRFDIPGGGGEVEAAVPWEMVIDVDAESVSADPRWTGAFLRAPGIPLGLDGVSQVAEAVPAVEDRARDLPGKVNQQTSDGGLSGTVPAPAPGPGDPANPVSASPAANGAPAGSPVATPASSSDGLSYAACLDDFYLRVADDYSIEHWLPAMVWYCWDLAPAPQDGGSVDRCVLDRMEEVEKEYSDSGERWGWWYAIAVCKPLPSADESHIPVLSGVQPTVYGACLDNAYLSNRELIDDREVLVGVSAWLCQSYLPEPPATHLRRCDLEQVSGTRELYPEWPGELHDWHAIMQCLPGWRAHEVPGESAYETYLSDVYLQVQDSYERKDRAIPAAVWRCRDYMPEPPLSTIPGARSAIAEGTRTRSCSGPGNFTLGTP